MTDKSRFSGAGDNGGMAYERSSSNGIPRWVKVAGIVVAIVVLVVVVMAVVLPGDGDDGGHTPRRHSSGGSQTPSVAVETGVLKA